VAFLGAYRNPGALDPITAGVLGSALTVWVTFMPCFLFIFLGAPYIELLRANQSLNAAMSCITAAVVGVVLNLAMWFTLNTIFGRLRESYFLGAHLQIPVLETINMPSVIIAIVAFAALFRFKMSMMFTIAACAALGVAYHVMRISLG
jgi:chromate transporter